MQIIKLWNQIIPWELFAFNFYILDLLILNLVDQGGDLVSPDVCLGDDSVS